MALERLFVACGEVPEPHRPIARSRRQDLSVRREDDGQDVTAMALEHLFVSTRSAVPEPHRPIARSRRQDVTVGREGDGIGRTTVALECLQALIPSLSKASYGRDI
ncbi:hypothetical protein NW757_014088 [Fusarium falciforme]|nr:hypothetical protein NW757_014088 [Fusarium falciforme]